jgi:ATP-binding cassette subfamily B protein
MADKIIVISDGVVSESGSHSSLMQADGLYAKMFKAQSAWYVSDNISSMGGVME